MTGTTLADRVYALISEEYGEGSTQLCRDVADSEPQGRRDQLSLREGDLRDWGLICGLAFGILEAEAPADADREAMRDQALDAARAVYRRWAGEIAPRPVVSPMVDAAVLAFDDAEPGLSVATYVHGHHELKPLLQSMHNLREAIGIPVAA
jgi:hypothetical protein